MNQLNSQIEQLVIDRDSKKTNNPKRQYLIISITICLIATLVIIVNQENSVEAESNSVQNSITTHDVSNQSIAENDIHIPASNDSINSLKVNKSTDKNSSVYPDKPVLDASGHIVARRIATVSSRVTGKIEQLNIEEGQKVFKDQVLAELDHKQAQIGYRLALAELSANKAAYEELLVLQQHEQQQNNRRQTLVKSQLVSFEVAEFSESKTQQIAAQIKNRVAQIQSAEQRVALAQYQLDQHKIRAPFDGIVISKNAQVGELISAGSSSGGFIRTGVGTIVDMSSLEIEVEVGESYIDRVYAGQRVEARLDAYPQWKIDSQVIAIIPTADRQKASIKVRVKLLENDSRILPDMGVKVSFFNQELVSDRKQRISGVTQ